MILCHHEPVGSRVKNREIHLVPWPQRSYSHSLPFHPTPIFEDNQALFRRILHAPSNGMARGIVPLILPLVGFHCKTYATKGTSPLLRRRAGFGEKWEMGLTTCTNENQGWGQGQKTRLSRNPDPPPTKPVSRPCMDSGHSWRLGSRLKPEGRHLFKNRSARRFLYSGCVAHKTSRTIPFQNRPALEMIETLFVLPLRYDLDFAARPPNDRKYGTLIVLLAGLTNSVSQIVVVAPNAKVEHPRPPSTKPASNSSLTVGASGSSGLLPSLLPLGSDESGNHLFLSVFSTSTFSLRNRRLQVRTLWGVLDLRQFLFVCPRNCPKNEKAPSCQTGPKRAFRSPLLVFLNRLEGSKMPHFPKPYFRKGRGVWYVEINRKQHNLGPDKDEAFRLYHELMRQPHEQKVSPESLAGIIDAFLDWVSKHRAKDTYEWYLYRLQRFIDTYPDMRAMDLRPFHVETWADS